MSEQQRDSVSAGGGNRLASEKSPYLLQHAGNPVDWYAWGDEAFEQARKQDKPIFLSIGYSTCHWCHVMEAESFENEQVAELMNEAFVCIKVDREERPDVDAIYMAVCQMMTGGGGWPLTIIMTPDKKPFFAGTYIPRQSRFGCKGMLELIPALRQLWAERRGELLGQSERMVQALQEMSAGRARWPLDEAVLEAAYWQLAESFDRQHGGFGTAPKFPTPHNLLFLLRYWKRSGRATALEMVEKTLQAMRAGGIYDQLGFGFHRYSTDAGWLVPHFEKMLYDQALLAIAYLEAYQATGKEEYATTAREIFTYVLRDMTGAEGGFYSAQDADSEGIEGKFYLWREDELRSVLSDENAELAMRVFCARAQGNFIEQGGGSPAGGNILHLAESMEKLAQQMKVSETELRGRLEAIRKELWAEREHRVHPGKDDKVLADWNGLMIAALAKGSGVLDEPEYAQQAGRAVYFILQNMVNGQGHLLHRYRDGQAAVAANLDDYAFLVWGLLELYEATFEVDYLRKALELNGDLLKHFWDEQNGGFYFTADYAEELLVRRKESYDGAVPSGNSAAMLNLLRLGRISAQPELEAKAARVGEVFSEMVRQMPSAHSLMLSAADFAVGPSFEVVIAGDSQGADTREMFRLLGRAFVPNKVVVLRNMAEKSPAIVELAKYCVSQTAIDGKATAYVCRNYRCELPTTDPGKMMKLLQAK